MRQVIYTIIIIFFIIPPEVLFGQSDHTSIRGTIAWDNPLKTPTGEYLLTFEGAVNHDGYGLLPALQIPLPARKGEEVVHAFLSECTFQPVEITNPDLFPDLDLIASEPVILIDEINQREDNSQAAYVIPLKKASEGEGYEQLVSYTITLEYRIDDGTGDRAGNHVYAEHSVLRFGDWYRISVRQTGIHKITYNDLVSMGLDPSQADPRNIRIFGNGNGMVEESVSIPRPDDLIENAIFIHGEEDGSFDPEDYILFYGQGPVVMRYNPFYLKYEHEVNFYTDETFYFLTSGTVAGRRVQAGQFIPDEPTHIVTSFEELAYHEKDEVNLIKSGQVWYGEVFNTQLEYHFNFNLTNIDPEQPVYFKGSLAGRSTINTDFEIYAEGTLLATVDVPSIVLGSSIYARALTTNYESFFATDDQVDIGVTFIKPGVTDVGWLNHLQLNYIRHLVFNGKQMGFRDMRAVGGGNIARYDMQTSVEELTIWDVTNPGQIIIPQFDRTAWGISFKDHSDTLKEYIAFDATEFLAPVFVEKVENQDLHSLQSVDFLIISYPDFLDQANRLADYHRQQDGFSVAIVTPQQIYNEFSSGAQDVSAIRDFIKMIYDRGQEGNTLKYLLLFGDASYDFKGILPEDNNLVPAYQSRESLKMAASFVTDDFFGCLDEDEGSNGSGTVDIGIGRFPVNSLEQAVEAVDKVFRYAELSIENFGPWRNEICYVGDDEDNNIHLAQAEGLSEIADSLGGSFNLTKVYLDAYAQLQTPSGTRYPDASLAIDNSVSNGSLYVNYTGHGGEIGWATERVLDIPAIQAYKNAHNMPAFVTATCEFSRYDDPALVSAGELVFLNSKGAGIGLFTTTRLAYSQSNYALNKRFYYEAFQIDSLTGDYPRMGDLIRVAKTPSNQNIKNFVLLGDPALMLAYPKLRVVTDSIINETQDRLADTIHALSMVTVTGHLEDLHGNPYPGFNGILYPTVYDKPTVYKTRGNDPTSKVTEFLVQDKVLFKGESSIIDGKFTFTFIVPKDISYQLGQGKISYYGVDTLNFLDANGHQHVWIGGSDSLAVVDETGPAIELYLNNLEFQSGDVTTASPVLIAKLYDESGINTMGNGIGHDIVAVVDGNYQMSVVLNDYFTTATDSYQTGDILYPLGSFQNGIHTLTLKAWDVFNNSSEKTIEFKVNTGEKLSITHVLNYPNPFGDQTRFEFEHNKPGVGMAVNIRIYNIMGQPVHAFQYEFNTESLTSAPYFWNGRGADGNELPGGLYVYHIRVTSDDGFISEVAQKLLIAK